MAMGMALMKSVTTWRMAYPAFYSLLPTLKTPSTIILLKPRRVARFENGLLPAIFWRSSPALNMRAKAVMI